MDPAPSRGRTISLFCMYQVPTTRRRKVSPPPRRPLGTLRNKGRLGRRPCYRYPITLTDIDERREVNAPCQTMSHLSEKVLLQHQDSVLRQSTRDNPSSWTPFPPHSVLLPRLFPLQLFRSTILLSLESCRLRQTTGKSWPKGTLSLLHAILMA